MAHQRDRLALKELLEDYSKLEGNTAWHYFLNYVKQEAFEKLKNCGKEEYNYEKIKYWQGAHRALKAVYEDYPAEVYNEIKREIEK